jgi:deoxyribodipyrimidine photo-lyase
VRSPGAATLKKFDADGYMRDVERLVAAKRV